MRRYRRGLIQTPEQLRFSYMAIIQGAETIAQEPCNPMKRNRKRPAEEDDCHDVNKREAKSQLCKSLIGSKTGQSSSSSVSSTSKTGSSTKPSRSPNCQVFNDTDSGNHVSTFNSPTEFSDGTIEASIASSESVRSAAAISKEKSELRKRTRAEQNKNLEKNIERVKKNMREAEERQKFRKSLMKYTVVGFVVAVVGVFVYNYGLNSRLNLQSIS